MKEIYLSTQTTLIITIVVGAFFIALGYTNLKKISDNKKSHIIGDRNENIFSLTTSLGYCLTPSINTPSRFFPLRIIQTPLT